MNPNGTARSVGKLGWPRADHIAPLALNAWLRYDALTRMLPPGITDVLEVGCGQGGFGVRLAQRYQYLGVEPDPASFTVAQHRIGLAGRGEVRNIAVEDLGDDQFDMVCAFEVLEHFEDDAAAAKSWTARLRPGGWLVVSMPAHNDRLGPFDELVGHYRRYDHAMVSALLEPLGFEQVETRLYGVPLGYALETARNVVGKRRLAQAKTSSTAERTAGSGRVMQPKGSALGLATRVATAPFRLVQRGFPGNGTGLIARARLSRS
jgi:SAM-dependent methyltransferase